MSMRLALASLLAADLYLLWRLFQGDLGGSTQASRDVLVLAMAACTLLAVTIAIAMLPRARRRTALLVVRNGAIQRADGSLPALDRGRAWTIVVQEGHVAVLEKQGRFARTLGPGRGRLNRGETIHKVILTGPRQLVGTVDSSTRDSVPVTAEFELDARILPARGEAASFRPSSPVASQNPSGKTATRGFVWSPDAVVRAAYAAPNWEVAILNAARHSLSEQLARAALEDIFDLEEIAREAFPFSAIADRVRLELNDQSRAWGAEVLRFQLNRVKIPSPTEQSILAKWNERHQLPSGPGIQADQQTNSEAPAPDQAVRKRGATLRLVPVLGRGPAASLREAVRQRLGYLTADAVEIGGDRYLIRPVSESAGGELSLRPDATYFAMAVHGDNLARNGATEGDYVLFESQSDAASGNLAATLIGGDLGIKRLTRKPGHSLLEPDCSGRPMVVVTDRDAHRDELFAEYASCLPPVEYWPADDARILGSAVMIFQPLAPGPRPAGTDQMLDEGGPGPRDFLTAETIAAHAADDSADGEAPGEPPPLPSGSAQ
jgi:regulator of protease activity HflC (stomatin/prohibitin superfamily)